MASDPTVDFPEPKNLGEMLDRMPLNPAPSIFEPPQPKLGVYQAIAMIIDELGKAGIKKEGTVKEGGNFKYRGIDQVYAALNPLLSKHGLVILPRVISREQVERKSARGNALFYTTMKIEFDFVSTLDGSKHTVVTYGEAMDSGDKGSNKCMAIGFKYAAFLTFCVPVDAETADDPDDTVHAVQPKGQAQQSAQQPQTPPQPTEEEAKKAYTDAMDMLEACSTEGEIEKVWNEKINWDHIPKGWHPNVTKMRRDQSKAISRPRPGEAPTSSAPPTRTATVPPKFDVGPNDPDIPF